ncbi:MAG: ARMT1-like domain-containing protein [Planctomycetota bacterium]
MRDPVTVETRPFPLLADPANYRACQWDLTQLPERCNYWLSLFRSHFPSLLEAYRAEAEDRGEDVETVERAIAEAAERFNAYLDIIETDPAAFGRLDILEICYARERALRAAGIDDAYRLAKQTDTAHALELLPSLLEELDAMPEADRQVAIIEGIFAGNIYDLGATETVAMFKDTRVDFRVVRAKLKPRPWRFDALDAWLERLDGPPHRAAVLFVDNAGPDVTLGMIPFARELLKRGTSVILTANSQASLNDVTHAELIDLIEAVARLDNVVRTAIDERRLNLVPSGNNAPLIDLGGVSIELAEALEVEGIDLVVLEGMGRSLESNFDAEFSCDTLKLAMIKDLGVGEAIGAELFDLMMKFEPSRTQ